MTWWAWASPDSNNVPGTSGFDAAPPRPRWLTVFLFCIVVGAAAGVAHLFRYTAEALIEWYSDAPHPLEAAESVRWFVAAGIVSTAVFSAACLGRFVEIRRASGTGIEAVAASARGERRRISLRASGLRAAGTWLASGGLSSIGRESAIIEMGGAFGTVAGRRSGGRGDVLATAGIAAAFAAAYHAPFAAVVYVEEHLRVSRSPRALWFATTGALAGHLVSTRIMGAHVIFPAPTGSTWETLALSLLVVVPSVVGARVFRVCRVRVKAAAVADRLRVPWWTVAVVFAVAAGAAIATFPSAAGNGMEALRQASVGTTLTIALALSIGKLVGTTASLGSGAPGGSLTPTISIASGSALLSLIGLEHLGVDVGIDVSWGVMVSAMAVGIAVGLRSPLLAIVLIPELVGDYTILPLIAVAVAAAALVNFGIDHAAARVGPRAPDVIYDDDG